MKLIDKLAWIEIQSRKVLSTRSQGKDVYYIPGGKRETGETDHQALIREIQEELTITLRADSLKYLGTFQAQAHGHATGIEVKMTCYTGLFEGTITASSEIEEVVWLTYADRFKSSQTDVLIFDWLKEQDLID
ncbi:NUDIX hydrolase [Pontibacter vulgaris]|uniref:NUDIX hydrolase n=1 Tax=Pontibacter vulgaris TaxID=2905679 RepID=UPI001FA741DA|nr:NUDIX domain-containing protein [Pontibacter vulgaris]